MKTSARVATLVVSAAGLWVACATTQYHLFIAGQYLPRLDCVTPGEVIDILNEAGVDANCDATCVVPPEDAGVYITGACAPFPPGDLVNPDSSPLRELCAKGLAAIHRSDLCLEGGPSNPAMDAGVDSGVDSGVHVATDTGVDTGAHDAHEAGVADAGHG